jgi:hypothetical protein
MKPPSVVTLRRTVAAAADGDAEGGGADGAAEGAKDGVTDGGGALLEAGAFPQPTTNKTDAVAAATLLIRTGIGTPLVS